MHSMACRWRRPPSVQPLEGELPVPCGPHLGTCPGTSLMSGKALEHILWHENKSWCDSRGLENRKVWKVGPEGPSLEGRGRGFPFPDSTSPASPEQALAVDSLGLREVGTAEHEQVDRDFKERAGGLRAQEELVFETKA